MIQPNVSRRGFLAQSAVGSAIAGLAAARSGHADDTSPQRPNIVFVLVDDLRFDALGIMGHPFVETPQIDALARGGMVFDRAFVTTSLCSPSRASILTGLYAHAHGVFDNQTPLDDAIPTFPRLLQRAGYRTAFVGKWHMGGDTDEPRPGFDHWVSFRGQGVYENPTFNVNGEQRKMSGYVTDLITDDAIAYLRAQDAAAPFFLYVSHKAVHAEFIPAPRHRGCYAAQRYPHPASMADTDENYRGKPNWVRAQRNSWHGVDGMYDNKVDFDDFARAYAETLRAVDDSVGRMVQTLREMNRIDDTLFVFTSDNGFQFGEHGLIDKRTMYEASIRVPLIAHMPSRIKPGSRSEELATNLDLAPTFLELAGAEVPQHLHGASLRPLLDGTGAWNRDAILYQYFWERSFPQTPTVLGVRTKSHKLMRYHGIWDRYELYDLIRDPDEMNNLIGEFMVETHGGSLDNVIRNNAPEDVRSTFLELSRRLDELLEQTACAPEPSWARPASAKAR